MSEIADTFQVRLQKGCAVVEGDVDGNGESGRVLEVREGAELHGLSGPSRAAILAAVAQFGSSLTVLSEAHAKHLAPLHDATERVVQLMVTDVTGESAAPSEIAERAQVAIDVFQVVFAGNKGQLDALIEALKPVALSEDPNEIDLEEAEARARLRLKAMYRRMLDESLSVAAAKEELGLSRQRLKQLRDEDRLFAIDVPVQKGLVYPTWQFDLSGRPRPVMQRIVRAAKEANLDSIGLHLLMTGHREGAKTGVELLNESREDLVLSMIRGVDR